MTDIGDAESSMPEEDLALDRIRGNGLEPTGGPTLSDSANFFVPSMCLSVARLAQASPKTSSPSVLVVGP